jgi:hypothetical protein
MPNESPFISDADRNTLTVCGDTYHALLELGRLVEDATCEAKEASNLLRAAATSERPAKREEAYLACKKTQLSARAAFELSADVDNDAGTLRAMSRNLARNTD